MDDLIGASSEHFAFSEPEDQKNEREKEQNAVLSELPILQAVVTRLRADVDTYRSIDAIPKDIRLNPAKLAIRVDSNCETVANLLREVSIIEDLVKEYTERL